MVLGIVGPVELAQLSPLLGGECVDPAQLPKGQASTAVSHLVAGMVGRGHDVLLVTLSGDVADEVILEGPRLRICVGPWRSRHRTRDAFRAERSYITRALRREAPPLVHAQWTYWYALGALRTGLPCLVSVRDWTPSDLRFFRQPAWVVRFFMNALTLQQGRHFTVSSPFMQDRVQRFARRPATLIPNGLRDEQFLNTERRMKGTPPVLLAVNNGFSVRKNVFRLLEAFPVICQGHQARLQLVGQDYEEGGRAHLWARERGLSAGVEFLGPRPHDEVTRLMRDADVFVHPSLQESFGNVLVEAMAQRLPVVAGAVSGAASWVTGQGAAGRLTNVTSSSAVAEAVLSLLDDDAAWLAASQDGYAHASKQFRLSQVLEAYEREYERVLTHADGSSRRVRLFSTVRENRHA